MKKVGFIFTNGVPAWNGGVNYYTNLIRILHESGQYEPIIFCSPEISDICKEKFLGVTVIKCEAITGPYLKAYLRKACFYLFRRNFFLDSYLKNEKIEIVSHNEVSLDRKSKIPSCGWIPDFQCIHYPQFFSKKNIRHNRFNYKYLAKYSTKIVVSSNSCKEDLINLVGKSVNKKAEVFHFGLPPFDTQQDYTIDLMKKYNVNAYKYYVVSNQFWQHKNHMVIVNALKIMFDAGIEIPFKIIVTGLINDPRDPDASKKLKEFVNTNKLESFFIMTDMISYEDVLSLQNYSLAIIQPSLFEGWNTAVEECKRIGKKLILSNIAVHIEQSPKNVVYFDPHNAKELARVLLDVYRNYDMAKELKFRKSAILDQKIKWQDFSKSYCSLLEKTIKQGACTKNG